MVHQNDGSYQYQDLDATTGNTGRMGTVQLSRSFANIRNDNTRRTGGAGLKIREHYIRTDEVPFVLVTDPSIKGFQCLDKIVTNATATTRNIEEETNQSCIIIPDANCLMMYMELFEKIEFSFLDNIIFCQTILDELNESFKIRERRRLQNIMNQPSKLCTILMDGNYIHTFVPMVDGSSSSSSSSSSLLLLQEKKISLEIKRLKRVYEWITHEIGKSTSIKAKAKVIILSEYDSTMFGENIEVMNCENFINRWCPMGPDRLLANEIRKAGIGVHEKNLKEQEKEQEQEGKEQEQNKLFKIKKYGEGTPYLNQDVIRQGIKERFIFRGKFDVCHYNFCEGFVILSSPMNANVTKIYVKGIQNINRCLHGDTVAVQLLPRSEWEIPSNFRSLVYSDDNNNDSEEIKQVKDKLINIANNSIPTGKIVGLLERDWKKAYVVTIPPEDAKRLQGNEEAVLALPMNSKFPKIRLKSRQAMLLSGKRLVVCIAKWDLDSFYPQGQYIRSLGEIGTIEAEVSSLMVEHNLQQNYFSSNAMACLPFVPNPPNEPQVKISDSNIKGKKESIYSSFKEAEGTATATATGWSVSEEEVLKRYDIRESHRVFSVDPMGCTDIDDAMSVKTLENGNLEVGVHIADVTHFVKSNSPLDLEARERGTTIYLTHRRYDMLPTLLSGHLCSLQGGVDRYAVSVFWEMSPPPDCAIIPGKIRFCRTVIHSCAAMTYEQGHRILQGVDANSPVDNLKIRQIGEAGAPVPKILQKTLKNDLHLLTMVSRALRKNRFDNGAMDLNAETGELKFDMKEGSPLSTYTKEHLEIHDTIAELMILANTSVAVKILDHFPSQALLRYHVAASSEKYEELSTCAKEAGLNIEADNKKDILETTFTKVKNSVTKSMFQFLAIRAMSEALYVSTGTLLEGKTEDEVDIIFKHFGLGINVYTHFTSPIRRYADIIVHRLLMLAVYDDQRKQNEDLNDRIISENEIEFIDKGIKLPKSSTLSTLTIGKDVRASKRGGLSQLLDSVENPDGTTVWNKISSTTTIPAVVSDEESDEVNDDFLNDLLSDDSDNDDFDNDSKKPTNHIILSAENENENENENEKKEDVIFSQNKMQDVCDHINKQNRNAKRVSQDCNLLFLKLYFNQNRAGEICEAVVFSLKENGFMAYIPKFDFRRPVFLKDRNGIVQMDPAVVHLPSDYGSSPSKNFEFYNKCRSIPALQIALSDNEGKEEDEQKILPSLKIFKDNKMINPILSINVLDRVLVHVSCEINSSQARLPDIRLNFVSTLSSSSSSSSTKNKEMKKSKSENLQLKNTTTNDILMEKDFLVKEVISNNQRTANVNNNNNNNIKNFDDDIKDVEPLSGDTIYSIANSFYTDAIKTSIVNSKIDNIKTNSTNQENEELKRFEAMKNENSKKKIIQKAIKAERGSKGCRGRFYFQGFKTEEQSSNKNEFHVSQNDSTLDQNTTGTTTTSAVDSYTYDDYRRIEREATSRIQHSKKDKGKSKRY